MRVSAVVVNWNGGEDLPGCLDGLLAQTHERLDVLVVDNASTDTSAEVLRRYADRVRVRWNGTNRGYAGGANDGLTATDGDAVLVCNPDVRLRPDYVAAAVDALASAADVGSVQGKVLRTARAPDGSPVIDTTGHVAFRTRLFRNRGEGEIDRGQWDRPGEVFGVSGAVALYRRSMLDDLALPRPHAGREVWDEELFAFWEDVDLDWRAARAGWRALYAPAAVAEHERGGAGPRRTTRVEALNWRNRLLTVVKNDDPRRLLAAAPGVVLTTLLKTAELALTDPAALVGALRDWRLVRVMRAKRRLVDATARRTAAEVVERWFEPFDYGRWVATWWRRVRGAPLGT